MRLPVKQLLKTDRRTLQDGLCKITEKHLKKNAHVKLTSGATCTKASAPFKRLKNGIWIFTSM